VRPTVVFSISDDDADGRERLARGDVDGADWAEIRADRLAESEVLAAVRRSAVPTLVTARIPAEGGAWDRGEVERARLYRAALDAGAVAVDVEVRSPLAAAIGTGGDERLDPSRVVASWHGGPCETRALAERLRGLAATGATRLKLVPRASAIDDVLAVRETLADARRSGLDLACFALGRAGRISRLLAPSWGSWATYGAATPLRATGDGQFAARDLVEVYRVAEVGERTARYGLLGGDLSASPSPAMHAAGHRAAGLDAVYLPLETDDLDAFERFRARVPFDGVGVTVPHKEAAAARCLALDRWAGESGAVNTVRFEGPAWSGSNTDASGLARVLAARVNLAGRPALVVGAGGTGRTAARVLAAAGARVTVVNRTDERARRVAEAVGASGAPGADRAASAADILVRAVPAGAGEDPAVAHRPAGVRVVVDFAYGAEADARARRERERGIEVVDGVELLAAQGADQFGILTGAAVDETVLRRVARAWLDRRGAGSAPPAGRA